MRCNAQCTNMARAARSWSITYLCTPHRRTRVRPATPPWPCWRNCPTQKTRCCRRITRRSCFTFSFGQLMSFVLNARLYIVVVGYSGGLWSTTTVLVKHRICQASSGSVAKSRCWATREQRHGLKWRALVDLHSFSEASDTSGFKRFGSKTTALRYSRTRCWSAALFRSWRVPCRSALCYKNRLHALPQ